MSAQNWADPDARSVAVLLDGSKDPDLDMDGTPLLDDDFLVLFNAWWEPLIFAVPAEVASRDWTIQVDSFDPARTGMAAGRIEVGPRSVVVLRLPQPPALS